MTTLRQTMLAWADEIEATPSRGPGRPFLAQEIRDKVAEAEPDPLLAAVTDLADTLRRDADQLQAMSDAKWEAILAVGGGNEVNAARIAAKANGVRLALSKLDDLIRAHKGE